MTTKLALIELHGPAIPRPTDLPPDQPWRYRPFWTLKAAVPAFGLNNVKDEQGVQEDEILPVRTLLADAAVHEGDSEHWRRPRLMSMHLIAGASGDYRLSGEELEFEFPQDMTFEVDDGDFRTVDLADPSSATFQHVTVEPILDGAAVWPRNNEVPPFRLVGGAIDVASDAKEFAFLGPLLGKDKKDKNDQNVLVRLTPDGIELKREAPFPGQAHDIEGRFLLQVTPAGTRLRLLTERRTEAQLKPWRDAWFSLTVKDDTDSRKVVGLKVEGRRDARPPAFVWRVDVKEGGIQPLKPSVDVPAADVDVRLLSPRTSRGIDGEVTLAPQSYTVATLKAADIPARVPVDWKEADVPVVLIAELRPARDAAGKEPKLTTRMRFNADKDKLEAHLLTSTDSSANVAHRCAHDEVKLAAALRRAYGVADLLPGIPDPERPMLAAYVPVDDGWLQVPVPNVPPPDASKDDIAIPEAQTISNVLSGYLRFAQTGNAPAVLSAFGASLVVGEAPWVITIEGARAAAFIAGIRPGGTSAELIRGAVALDDPDLSTRGMFWLSADRPDAFEALPRIGAGSGSYFDLPLETYDIEKQSAVQFTISELALGVTLAHKDPQNNPHVVTRTGLAVEVAFDSVSPTGWEQVTASGREALETARDVLTGGRTAAKILVPPPLPPVRWQRHPVMPLAAEMPMTRGAAASVRPLESRDLVPFVIEVEDPQKDKPSRWLRLTWKDAAVYPQVEKGGGGPLNARPVRRWPWPEATFKPEHGIALTAFGVPGAELSFPVPVSKADSDPWRLLKFALRYDIPTLDEAFATATLPPQPPEKALPEEREVPPPVPVPLAYDWLTMRRFWEEQDRRHQVARVAHSYMVPQNEIGKAQSVEDLVDGLPWQTTVDFKAAQKTDPIPYGSAVIGGASLTANAALLGANIPKLTIKANKLQEDGNGTVKVLGYAPESFRDDDGFLMDSRLSGVRTPKAANGILWRAIKDRNTSVIGLATLLAEVKVADLFTFWFKDLPVDKTGNFKPIAQDDDSTFVDFNAWQDGNLPRSGFEWRLIPTGGADQMFRFGRDRVPFFGFSLEPLRLTSCLLMMSDDMPTRIDSVTIDARLHLGPLRRVSTQDGNVVTLTLVDDGAGGGLKIKDTDGLMATDLGFVLEPTEGSKSRVRLTTNANWRKSTPQKPAGLDFDVQKTKLFVTMFGQEREFGRPVVTAQPGMVTAVVPEVDMPEPKVFALQGILVVQKVTLRVEDSENVKLTLDRRIFLMPKAQTSSTTQSADAAIRVTMEDDVVQDVKILGITVKSADGNLQELVALQELDGAFILRTTTAVKINEPILPGFPIQGTLSFGFAARIGPMLDGLSDLSAGYFDGEIVTTKTAEGPVRIQRVSLSSERGRRTDPPQATPWTGVIRFHGSIELRNAIVWPEIDDKSSDPSIPFPKQPGVVNGRKLVGIKDASYKHTVTYILDGHALPFDVAARLSDENDDKTVWTFPLVSKHTITKSNDTLIGSFTAVETIAIGRALAVVPRPDVADALTFGPRRANTVENGDDSGKTEIGMIEDRIGRIGTVLSGSLGLPFRRAFWQTAHAGLFLAGGFVGLLTSTEVEDAPLLRLPVFAPLDGTALMIGQKGFGKNIEVAWSDGRAARNIIATMRSAVAPTSTSDTAIRTAMLVGSRAIASAGIAPDVTVAAVLVEQSFAVATQAENLDKTLFFVAAAVSLARSLDRLNPTQQPAVLSLLAGYGIVNKNNTRSLASAIVTRSLDESSDRNGQLVHKDPELATIGDDLVVRPWTGPNVADLGDTVPIALIAGPAFADHVQPRATLLRTAEQSGQWRYDTPDLPRPFERTHIAPPVVERDRVFPDAGRGYALPLGDDSLRWLSAPDEIEMRPFRDADLLGDKSGLAGLSRITAMPAHAAKIPARVAAPGDGETNDPVRNQVVWVAQTRTPVYLPLSLSSVKSTPFPWLTPGTPRPRNPGAESMATAFEKLDVKIENDTIRAVQPILPAGATIASVGDRSGISLARITRFETALGKLAAFDGRNARFGRPAQGGAWSVRTERTPRPGVLPRNLGNQEERDRRPCWSSILIDRPLAALAGPADRVSGEANSGIGAWTVTFVAAQEWEGMITDSWDGTLRLCAEVDVEANNVAPTDVVETLLRLLFPLTAMPKQMRASASLVIGNIALPFVRIHFERSLAFDDINGVKRGVVSFVLDARTDDSSHSPGAALRAAADALADDVLPAVEVQLVVYPESRPKPENSQPPVILDLTSPASALAEGDGRAPVTLRMPLAPVIRSRGALPLARNSLLFIDPSYNAGLSSQAAEDRELVAATTNPAVPETRGALAVTLYADRDRVNRRASVTFMIDLAFERKLDALSQEALANEADGDLVRNSINGSFELRVRVVPRSGARRMLFVANPMFVPKITLAKVYELPLSNLTEENGTPAVLAAGDILELEVAENNEARVTAKVFGNSRTSTIDVLQLDPTPVLRRLLIILSDEPVAAPPSALYAALVRRERAPQDVTLSLPLYAQSPLPWRVDLRDAKNDFRRGLMRRAAIFVWNLSRPTAERKNTGIFIVKVDRNGQTFLPDTETLFEKSRSLLIDEVTD